ncbi:oligopeptide/dipeptide ABC transporter ATPase [Thermincola ferriacetica]|uniref:Oligopeptide/dipeptide ABC transporter ATPase n=1 Tax=Thermincola ferriacetica TaxID=281456 RepID=A0A0L6W0H7_9FIRM|nr:ABC transporter ATP-binding protein [Thermincola ferriacetica]KNZ69030.1 oligopeptide/dipeptide ABC transporter ATPase [Thermincola ferriacetica]
MAETLLAVEDLKTYFYTEAGVVKAVDGVSFTLKKGETLGVVGESGSGKSITAMSILQLIASPPGRIVGGKIIFNGENLLDKSPEEIRKIRGNEIAMIFQDPMTSLNPVLTIGEQLIEVIILHQKLDKKSAAKKAVEMLSLVGIPEAEKRLKAYPHQFSGGMRQRAMIAIALSCNPKLLIADEPTTALDVTIQAQILKLMNDLKERFHTSIMMITHDLGVVAEICDDVVVMYAGRPVEYADVNTLFESPLHPYTWGLLASLPRIDDREKKRLEPIEGLPPDLVNMPPGCPFAPRCKKAMEICRVQRPEYREIKKGHLVACHLYLNMGDQ